MKNLEVLIDVCAAHATISLWRRASNTVEISGSEECGRKVYWSTAAMQFDEVHIRVQTQWDSAFILLWMWQKTVESLQLYRRSVLLQVSNDNKLFHHPRWVVTIYLSSLLIKAFVTMLKASFEHWPFFLLSQLSFLSCSATAKWFNISSMETGNWEYTNWLTGEASLVWWISSLLHCTGLQIGGKKNKFPHAGPL